MTGIRDRWAGYGDRPPIARWTSRIGYMLGLAIGWGLLAAVIVSLAFAVVCGIFALWPRLLRP